MATLNSQVISLPLPTVDFTWDPIGAFITFDLGGNTYPPVGPRFASTYTPINQLITFTADANPAADTEIIQYRWDMGDGVVQYGESIGHTYIVPNPSTTVRLEVVDNLGRKAYVSKVILLQSQYPTVVRSRIRASNDESGVLPLLAETSLDSSTSLVGEGYLPGGSWIF